MSDEQAMACLHCGLAGLVPPEHFPLPPGLWEQPCPTCGERAVWVTEVRPRDEADAPAIVDRRQDGGTRADNAKLTTRGPV